MIISLWMLTGSIICFDIGLWILTSVSVSVFRLNNLDKRRNNLFASLKKNERDKKKLIDTVLKQLKVLENGAA